MLRSQLPADGQVLALVRTASFSPDGTQLASASLDQTAILWNMKRILNLDPLAFGCDWVRDYLRTNAEVNQSDSLRDSFASRTLYDGVKTRQAEAVKIQGVFGLSFHE